MPAKKILIKLCVLVLFALAAAAATNTPANSYKGAQCYDPKLTPQERAGCEIWFYATAGNARFHAYVLPQRLPVLLDWYRVLNSKQRSDRFRAWGIINDPDCCTPGSPGCPKKSLSETYGMDYCPGDDVLLQYVGKPGYQDPACEFKDAPADPNDPHKGQRESACGLEFGTSTGALGFRKFPNPRFNAEQWRKVNNGLDDWSGFTRKVKPETFNSKLRDASIEPPFHFGMSCGACHIAFDPLNPPKDTANPKHENIKGAVGNQYTNVTAIMASGEATNSPLWRVFNYVRTGTVDTSAFPHDFNGNAGTPNAIINFDKRPNFPDEEVIKWYRSDRCPAGADINTCWCEPDRNGKCWERRTKKPGDPMDPISPVKHILKGGEDSVGLLEAIQRVYINIGSCSETCWLNHLTNFFVLDPAQRGYGQTPFNIGQCRRECPNFRAVEDRLPEVATFLAHQRPTDLYAARGLKSNQALVDQFDRELGKGSVALGQQVFADNCARCHSSQKPDATGSFRTVDFRAVDGNGVRIDFLSDDKAQLVSAIGTNRSRALHSNHMTGRVWQEYGSETLRARKPDPNVPDPGDGGRGYYRNTSLLSIWSHAPFMHNNAIGPEICGKPQDKKNDFYYSSYVDANDKEVDASKAPACWAYDASVEGRFKLYKASMEEMLTQPENRPRKVSLLNEAIVIEAGPKIWDPQQGKHVPVRIVIPKGVPQAMVGNLLYKQLVVDMVHAKTDKNALKARLKDDQAVNELEAMIGEFVAHLTQPLNVLEKHQALIKKHYMTSTDFWENSGHPFGTGLSDREKKALIAFVATL